MTGSGVFPCFPLHRHPGCARVLHEAQLFPPHTAPELLKLFPLMWLSRCGASVTSSSLPIPSCCPSAQQQSEPWPGRDRAADLGPLQFLSSCFIKGCSQEHGCLSASPPVSGSKDSSARCGMKCIQDSVTSVRAVHTTAIQNVSQAHSCNPNPR